MKGLLSFAIFLSATLLFMVQPLVAKILLPVLGGSIMRFFTFVWKVNF